MNLSDLRGLNLDFHNIGNWPMAVRAGAVAILCLVVLVAGYMVDIKPQIDTLRAAQAKEDELKTGYEAKQMKAGNLEEYKQQMKEMERSFGALLRQLPSKTEVAELLSDVSTAGIASGLEFDLFQPQAEVPREFYAELPIKMRVKGNYHDFGSFTSNVNALSRIVTLHDFVMSRPDKDGGRLVVETTARTYRYLDDAEIAEIAAKEKEKNKGKGKKA